MTTFGEQVRQVVESLHTILETTHAADRNRKILQ